jgi:hypothetical protein
MTPGALLGAALTGETSRRAVATVDMVRDQVLDAACDRGSKATAAREAAERRVGPFGRNGFPSALPARVGTLDTLGISRRRLTIAGASIAAVIVAVAVIASVGGQHAKTAAGGTGQAGLDGDSGAAATAGNDVRAAPDTTVSGQSATGSPSRSASPSAAARAGAPATTSAAESAPASGTIGVPSSVQLQPDGREWQGTLTVTVSGGSLSWSIADPDPGLRLSQSAGTSSASVEIGAFGRGSSSR